MHDPDVVAAFAIGNEGDPLAVGRKARLAVEGHAAINQLGFAALDRKRVDVAQEFEGESLAIGRGVERKPGAFIGGEGHFAIGLQGQRFFLVLLCVFLFVLLVLVLVLAAGGEGLRRILGDILRLARARFWRSQRGSRPATGRRPGSNAE
jgi:hypothetical protein